MNKFFLLTLMLFCVGLCGCGGSSPENRLNGKWICQLLGASGALNIDSAAKVYTVTLPSGKSVNGSYAISRTTGNGFDAIVRMGNDSEGEPVKITFMSDDIFTLVDPDPDEMPVTITCNRAK